MDVLARYAQRGRPTDMVTAQHGLAPSVRATVDASQLDTTVLVTESVEDPPGNGRPLDRSEGRMPEPGDEVPNLRPWSDATSAPKTLVIEFRWISSLQMSIRPLEHR